MAEMIKGCEVVGCREVPEWIIKSRKYPENKRLQHVTCNEHLGKICQSLMSDETTSYDITMVQQEMGAPNAS